MPVVSYGQSTELMSTVLEDTVIKLPNELQTTRVRIELAKLILKFAAGGERDPSRLSTFALVHVMERYRERHRASSRHNGTGNGLVA
jgi:hypothetical protein